jgi:amino acid adenylation domain-containing protein/non-ribosomal peptide synthase protein (TIGR01720 family)
MAPIRTKQNIENIGYLSALQQGLLAHALQAGAADPYFYQTTFEIDGPLDVSAFGRAWEAAVARHAALRTDYRWEELAQPVQVVYRSGAAALEELDWRAMDGAAQDRELSDLLARERAQGFDFRRAADNRLRLARLAGERYCFIWSYHHVTLDGWSLALVLRDVMAAYRALAAGAAPQLAPARPYRDYIQWLQRQDHDAARGFWRAALAGMTETTPLPRQAASAAPGRHAEQAVHLSAATVQALRAFAAAHQLTMNTIMQGAWALLLARHARSAEAVFGTTVSGRPPALPGVEEMAGLFINTQPIRVALRPAQPLSAWLAQLQRQAADQRQFDYLPLAELQGLAALDDAGAPLFDTLVVFENYPVDASLTSQRGAVRLRHVRRGPQDDGAVRVTSGRNNYALSLIVKDGAQLELVLAYDSGRCADGTVAALLRQLGSVLEAFYAAPGAALGSIGLCNGSELEQVAAASQGEVLDLPCHTIAAQVGRHAAATPDASALRHEDTVLSWRELDQQSNRLAQFLAGHGVRPEVPVALCLPRGAALVVALLGIMKAGGACVPLDPKAPAQRLAWQLADCGAALAIGVAPPAGASASVTWLAPDDARLAACSDAPPPQRADARHAAYVIYTSGSTGEPKGVVISHGALANYVAAVRRRMPDADIASMAWVSTVAADLGHTVLFGALAGGKCLHVIDEERAADPDRFAEYMAQHQVDALKIVPSHLAGLLQAANPARVLPRRCLVLGGESTGLALAARLQGLAPDCLLLNHYGPTETTVGVLTCAYDPRHAPGSAALPLGRPLANNAVYVLDADLNPAPAGMRGEVYIGGAQLARGYLGRPGLTADRFLPSPFGPPGARLYRTGDTARRLGDGTLEYLDRSDHQVKIRGYRVEPGEVAAQLKSMPGVSDAVVLAVPVDGALRLAAYVVAPATTDTAALAARLAAQLPGHMVPSSLVRLDSWPLTANGKIDRKALPAPGAVAAPCAPGHAAAPRNEQETTLAAVWCEVLKREQVGIHDSFFTLGGDSILSLQVIARARARGWKLTPKQMFDNPTIADAARVAVRIAAKGAPAPSTAVPPAPVELPLTPIQAWFFEQRLAAPDHWNQSVVLAAAQPLETALLEAALHALVRHHDALRLRFAAGAGGADGAFRAAAVATAATSLPALQRFAIPADGAPQALAAIGAKLQAGLDIAQGPLLAAAHVRIGDGDHAPAEERLLIAIHHLVVDGVSWRVLLEDLQAAYRALQAGGQPELAPAGAWQTWARQLPACAAGAALQAELAYWLQPVRQRQLPCKDAQGDNTIGQARRIETTLDADTTHRLLHLAPSAYRTQVNDLLLSALAPVLCRWTGASDAWVELEGHGREELFDGADTSRTVGWFTTRFPVLLAPGESHGATIRAIKETLRAVPNKGIGHGLLKYLGSPASRAALAALPQPQVSFNYLGQFSQGENDLFTLAAQSAGPDRAPHNRRSHWLDIVGRVDDGCLSLAWTYSPAILDSAAIGQLAQDMLSALRALVAHCVAAEPGATPSDFPLAAQAGLSQAELDRLPLARIDDIYPLAPMQQGILFHSLMAPDRQTYVNQLHCTLSGPFDPAAFQAAWRHAVQTHAMLRTGFLCQREGEALQAVWRDAELPFEQRDWRAMQAGEHEQALAAFLEEDRQRGFELAQPPLMRVTLIARHDGATEFVWTKHHLLLDGWSSARLVNDVLSCYFTIAGGGRPALPAPRPYRDYVRWLMQQPRDGAMEYWRAALATLSGPLHLAGAMPRDATRAGHGELSRTLDGDACGALRAFAQREQVTLNTVLQAAWALLLSQHTGRRDIVFGVTVAGRPADVAGVDEMLGLFINTLPLHQCLAPEQALGNWLRALQADNAALRQHESAPLADIQRWCGVTGGQGLFDTLLVFENYPVDAALDGRRTRLGIAGVRAHQRTSYPLTLTVTPGVHMRIDAGYDRTSFGDATVAAMLDRLDVLLRSLPSLGGERIGNLPLLPAAELRQLTATWNDTATAYPDALPVHLQFERQAARTPDAVALVADGQRLTYRELNAAANRLAHRLIGAGVTPDMLVGICAQRSAGMVAGLLAILKAGGAYVPLDPDYPAERLAYMLDDARTGVLLAPPALASTLGLDRGCRVLALSGPDDSASCWPEHNPGLPAHPGQLAYTIYTSGSTGQPKGAGVPHGGLANRLAWMQQAYRLQADDRVLQKTPFGFDVSVWEFFWPLITGATLVMAPPGAHRDPAHLAALIREHGVTTLHFVPSMLQAFAEHGALPQCVSLRRVLASGEALPAELVQRHYRQGNVPLHNLYGPTEASIDVTAWACSAGDDSVPIGRPIANTQVYVLDHAMNPVPAGAVGELYIGGVQLARGYHRRPGLTAERFVPDPFGPPGARLYRSGDLARWRGDGAVEYLGRTDHQVKLRGLRIELGEIEARLLAHPQVREAAVLARGDTPGGLRLVGYVVAGTDGGAASGIAGVDPVAAPAMVTADALRAHLLATLPDYMAPSAWVFLDAMPLSPNGKLDRKALPEPVQGAGAGDYTAPRNPLETTLAAIWRDVLGIPQVGIHDNFFVLGGHSLLAMQVASRAAAALGRPVELARVFKLPTIAELAAELGAELAVAPARAAQDAALMADLLNELE